MSQTQNFLAFDLGAESGRAMVGQFDGKRFVQVGIRGPMYGEDDFDFHREHGITMIDIDVRSCLEARYRTWSLVDVNSGWSWDGSGKVTDRGDNPLPNAVVYLTNTRTRAVKTYIVGQDGSYRFPSLQPNLDYEVYAQHEGRKSDSKTVSQFDDRQQVTINLKIGK